MQSYIENGVKNDSQCAYLLNVFIYAMSLLYLKYNFEFDADNSSRQIVAIYIDTLPVVFLETEQGLGY